jgi:hypothetical protein
MYNKHACINADINERLRTSEGERENLTEEFKKM